MSNLGMQILYDLINKHPKFSAERVFSPWVDFENNLRKTRTKIFSLESRIFLDEFDIIGFSLQHELQYTNVLNILNLGGLELHSLKEVIVILLFAQVDLQPLTTSNGSIY